MEKITAACPEMTALASLVRGFAALLTPAVGNDAKLTDWIAAARTVDLPHLRSLTNGLEIDRSAVDAAVTACVSATSSSAGTRPRRRAKWGFNVPATSLPTTRCRLTVCSARRDALR
ncbi:hypothetical protein BN6_20050 [Saccharothrix espanaensis DSM 44229]|uniref:Transposase n=1 Tax=Saccharothrix espanaensis (strain ATCC 51144 / DSM 44229 / JCM 9112 / NBRC 15066 / NRRL 15764) TaxID=1179773 RepID=K0JTR8_SACES|nr:hypothetical protein BN6_20050 [Saccharothrix espanaensis DSM 44229]